MATNPYEVVAEEQEVASNATMTERNEDSKLGVETMWCWRCNDWCGFMAYEKWDSPLRHRYIFGTAQPGYVHKSRHYMKRWGWRCLVCAALNANETDVWSYNKFQDLLVNSTKKRKLRE